MVESQQLMLRVYAAMVPGIGVQAAFFGMDVVLNVAVAGAAAAAAEALCLRLRRRPPLRGLSDGTAIMTGALIGLAVPPGAHLFAPLVGAVAGVGLGKHAYGGIGQNVFNPAMVGYAIALISLPAAFANWPIDGTTGATALDALKHNDGMTLRELQAGPAFGNIGGYGWEWINAAFAAGGLVLMLRGDLAWRIPIAFLGSLALFALLFDDGGSSQSLGSPLLHLTAGSTMLTAFFVTTDPVTHPKDARAQVAYGVLIGAVCFVIRAWGSYPDGMAFGVLLANAVTPYLDRRSA